MLNLLLAAHTFGPGDFEVSPQEVVCLNNDNSNLNIRSAPSKTGKVLGSLKEGEKVEILAQTQEEIPWFYINKGGWIRSDFTCYISEDG